MASISQPIIHFKLRDCLSSLLQPKYNLTLFPTVPTIHQLGELARRSLWRINLRVAHEAGCLLPAEDYLESYAVMQRSLRADIDVLDDIAAVSVEHLVILERQNDALVIEEVDLALLAGFAAHRREFVRKVQRDELPVGYASVITPHREGLEEAGREMLLESRAAILGDWHEEELVPNDPFPRLRHNTESDLAPFVTELAHEWRVRFVGLGIEFRSSVTEMEAAALVACSGSERGCNKGECHDDGESELHSGYRAASEEGDR